MMSMIVSRAPGWEPPKKQVAPSEKAHSATPPNGKATAGSPTPPKPALVAESGEAANSQTEK